MAVANKTTIAFSLVSVPISMYTATQDSDISFNQLHEADGQRVRYKKVCGHCGQEVKSEDIVKATKLDKKMASGQIKFVLLKSIGKAYIDTTVTDEEMLEAVNSLNADLWSRE